MFKQKFIATSSVAFEHLFAGQFVQQARFADTLLADDANLRERRWTCRRFSAEKFGQKIVFNRPRFTVDQIKNVGQFLFYFAQQLIVGALLVRFLIGVLVGGECLRLSTSIVNH